MIKKALKYFLIFCLVVGAIQSITGKQNSNEPQKQQNQAQEQPKKQYTAVDVATMMEDLSKNAAAAQKKYKGQNLAVIGKVNVIDSDGNYISLRGNNPYEIFGVRCDIKRRDKTQEEFILNVVKGQNVTVLGTIRDVGEVIGYVMDVDAFQK